MLAAGALAEEAPTRVGEWTRLREEKRARAVPPRRGFLERQLLALEKAERPSVLDFNVGGFYPRLTNIASGSETGFGTRFWRPDIGRTSLDVHASAFFSADGYEFYDLQAGRLPHRGARFPARSTRGDDVYELGDLPRIGAGDFSLYGSARYQHYPEIAFFGLGSESRASRETSYLHQDALYEVVGGYQAARRGVAATVRAGYLQAFVGRGTRDDVPSTNERFGEGDAPGLAAQPDFYHLAASVLLDGRDRPGNPHRGGMLAFAAARFDQKDGSAYSFHRLAADARGYASLGSPQRVLAVRALASVDEAGLGARVPFYFQQALGGSRTLRGYPSFRFRGEKLLLLQAEYRWEAWPALELALFVDSGRAFRGGEDLSLERLRSDYGIGVRLKTHDHVLARVDVARGGEGTRVLLRLGPSF